MCIDTSKIPTSKNAGMELTSFKKSGEYTTSKIPVREVLKKNLDEQGKLFLLGNASLYNVSKRKPILKKTLENTK
jgi:hypothetical protein